MIGETHYELEITMREIPIQKLWFLSDLVLEMVQYIMDLTFL
jgi:hypothetical protein